MLSFFILLFHFCNSIYFFSTSEFSSFLPLEVEFLLKTGKIQIYFSQCTVYCKLVSYCCQQENSTLFYRNMKMLKISERRFSKLTDAS